jgi:hypothetical protein
MSRNGTIKALEAVTIQYLFKEVLHTRKRGFKPAENGVPESGAASQ